MTEEPQPHPSLQTASLSVQLDDAKGVTGATVHCLCLEVEIDGTKLVCCCECWYVDKKIYGALPRQKRQRRRAA